MSPTETPLTVSGTLPYMKNRQVTGFGNSVFKSILDALPMDAAPVTPINTQMAGSKPSSRGRSRTPTFLSASYLPEDTSGRGKTLLGQ